jgi:hypothetical protein
MHRSHRRESRAQKKFAGHRNSLSFSPLMRSAGQCASFINHFAAMPARWRAANLGGGVRAKELGATTMVRIVGIYRQPSESGRPGIRAMFA